MLRDGFLRFCDDPELACCRAEKELEQLRTENVRLQAVLAGLQELAKAKADGRLVELPCKVGDTVYFAQLICEYKHCDPPTRTFCCGCSDYAKNKFVIQSRAFTLLDLKNIGKTVFLTCEEAENALGGKDDV